MGILDELESIQKLRENGIITTAEFEIEKQKILNSEKDITKEIPNKKNSGLIIAIPILVIIILIVITIVVMNQYNKKISSIENSIPNEALNDKELTRISIFYTDLETIKTQFNQNCDDLSDKDDKEYAKIKNFDNSDAYGYNTHITDTIQITTDKEFDLFLLVFSQVDYGYGGDSNKTIKAYEEILLRSCFPSITEEDINYIRQEIGTLDNIKEIVESNEDPLKTTYAFYKNYEIIRNIVPDIKSDKIACTFLIREEQEYGGCGPEDDMEQDFWDGDTEQDYIDANQERISGGENQETKSNNYSQTNNSTYSITSQENTDNITTQQKEAVANITMPNLIGMSRAQAENQLKELGLRYTIKTTNSLNEELVFSQSISAGTTKPADEFGTITLEVYNKVSAIVVVTAKSSSTKIDLIGKTAKITLNGITKQNNYFNGDAVELTFSDITTPNINASVYIDDILMGTGTFNIEKQIQEGSSYGYGIYVYVTINI